MKNPRNVFSFESHERNFSQAPAADSEIARYRQQALMMFGSVMMPAVIYKGQTFERRVLGA